MLQVLPRSWRALRTQASRHAVKLRWSRSLAPLSYRIGRSLSYTHAKGAQDVLVRSEDSASATPVSPTPVAQRKLPLTCPGCGAPSQTVDPSSAGFYGEKQTREQNDRRKHEDSIFAAAFAGGGFESEMPAAERPTADKGTPICDRCHNLKYQSTGKSIAHPSTESIRSMIEESPHRHNHIYHIMDAADFPMSLIPNLTSALRLPRLRTQNRRSKSVRYIRDRIAEVHFIITRSDLLAPKKEQVDTLFAYMQDVLRTSLGRTGKNVRLGSIRLVSAKRGWWTKTVKEEIYRRGGGGFMVGKVNVGKSALVEAVYPKGRMDSINVAKLRAEAQAEQLGQPPIDEEPPFEQADMASMDQPTQDYIGMELDPSLANVADDVAGSTSYSPDAINKQETLSYSPAQEAAEEPASEAATTEVDDFVFDEDDMSLLPPAQPEVAYPTMPIVSALPGTTASPIRLPFGGGKGELIDLPGIERSSIDDYVKAECKKEMIMKHRIVPEQQSVKPGQSLLLGGLIRITPKTDDLVFLMYGFVPAALKPHVTSTDKAIAIQSGSYASTGEAYDGHVSSNATPAAKLCTQSAGSFSLRWDVTKQRAGPVTSSVAGKQKASTLPYVVYALDLLIEGVGWIEIVAQVRRKAVEQADMLQSNDPFLNDAVARHETHFPQIEVFSPRGQFIGVRKPMNGWLLGGPKTAPVHKQRARPRQSMSYQRRVAGGRAGSARKATIDTT